MIGCCSARHDADFIIHERGDADIFFGQVRWNGRDGEVDFAAEQCPSELMVGRLHHVQVGFPASSPHVVENGRQDGPSTKLERMPTRAIPLEAPLRRSISSSARCSPVSRSVACGKSDWPNAVSSIPVEWRRNNCTPSCCSSLRSVRLTAGCVSDKADAAAPTLPRRATFKNALSPRWSKAMHNCYGIEAKKQWREAGKGQKLSTAASRNSVATHIPEVASARSPGIRRGQLMATAYVNGQVIDGRGKAYKGYVIVDGDKIAEVGPGQSACAWESRSPARI